MEYVAKLFALMKSKNNRSSYKNSWKEECAIFGVTGTADAAHYVALGLHALQHRGEEATGILSYNKSSKDYNIHCAHGLVSDVFANKEVLKQLSGSSAIGHNRYSTSLGHNNRNLQPFYADFSNSEVGLCHNGNITNASILKNELQSQGSIFHSDSDSEIILHLMARNKGSTIDRLRSALTRLEGAFSLLLIDKDSLIVARDPNGFRPLQIGVLHDKTLVVSSESCGFDIINAEFRFDVEAGEIIELKDGNITRQKYHKNVKKSFCLFEYIYFSRPDSIIENRSVYSLRKLMGTILAKEQPSPSDLIVPIPDSGIPASLGFASQMKIPFDFGLIRNHYVGRTFIEPNDAIRHLGVKLKLTANKDIIRNKSITLVDDSLVRGTTAKRIIENVRNAGAKEVHLRLSCPPIRHPCYYGIDTPCKSELLAANHSIESIRKYINASSIGFLSLEGLQEAVDSFPGSKGFCNACFSGDYPRKRTIATNISNTKTDRSHLAIIEKNTP